MTKQRANLRSGVPVLLCGLTLAVGVTSLADGRSAELTRVAAAWLESLDETQREEALYDFDDSERFDLRLAPFFLEGLRRDGMSDEQWSGLRGVLGAALSEQGLAKVEAIMSLEREVRERDRQGGVFGWFGRFYHGEHRYYVALFGAPKEDTPWGLRLDGHHLSLNWTALPGGGLSVTPLFLGAEPRQVPAAWERAGLRVLAEEEDRARALWNALDPVQRQRASLALELASGPAGINRPLFLGEGERITPAKSVGLARSEMSASQRVLLDALIDTYLDNFASSISAPRREAIDAAGRDRVHFASAGGASSAEPLYYRVQGPTFLIEFDNTVAEADHVHAVWREFDGDFGRDLLAEHYAREHGAIKER